MGNNHYYTHGSAPSRIQMKIWHQQEPRGHTGPPLLLPAATACMCLPRWQCLDNHANTCLAGDGVLKLNRIDIPTRLRASLLTSSTELIAQRPRYSARSWRPQRSASRCSTSLAAGKTTWSTCCSQCLQMRSWPLPQSLWSPSGPVSSLPMSSATLAKLKTYKQRNTRRDQVTMECPNIFFCLSMEEIESPSEFYWFWHN